MAVVSIPTPGGHPGQTAGRPARSISALCGMLFVAAMLLGSPMLAAAEQIVVIGHPDLPKDSLTMVELKRIYLGQIQFLGGTRLVPLDYRGGADVKKSFLNAALGMTPYSYQSFWVKEVFKSGAIPPHKEVVAKELIVTVMQTPGAIGYVYQSDLQGVQGVKVLLRLN